MGLQRRIKQDKRAVRGGLSVWMVCEERPAGSEGGSRPQEPLGDKVIGRENAKGKGSEVGMCAWRG